MESVELFDKNRKRLAKTSRAFGISDTEELMRAYSANFTVACNDPVSIYLEEDSMFSLYGQLFDVLEINEETGNNDATTVKGSHVGYRLGNYYLPVGYSFVGTAQQVAQDVLNTAVDGNGNKSSSEFTVGTCINKSGSFSLNNTQPVSARAAVLAMKAMGAEVNFDNFTLNFPETCGSGNTLTIETGKNLVNIRRTYQKGNGNSYEVEFANTMRIDGSNSFAVGDNCIVIDHVRNRVIEQRIMTYTKCDDPTKDKITIGVFVKDSADLTQSMQVGIKDAQYSADSAQQTADGSVQQGVEYSNVSVSHDKGFYAALLDGTHTQMNGSGVKSTRTDGSYSMQDGTGFKNVAPDGSFMLMSAKGLTHHTGGSADVESDYHYLSQSGSVTSVFTDDDSFTNVIITLNPEFIGKNINISLMVSDVYINKPTGSTAAYATIRQYKCVIAGIDNTTGQFLLLAALEGYSSKGEPTQLGGMTINWIAIA